jgi:type VI secretion system protein ImpH
MESLACHDRPPVPGVNQTMPPSSLPLHLLHDLLNQPERFDVFQALHWLERSAPLHAPAGEGLGVNEAVRIRAKVSLAFEPSDVQSIQPLPSEGGAAPAWELTSPVMSLAGAHGPLPLSFTEALLERKRLRDQAGLAFLDLFNHRLLALLYRNRKKHRPALATGPLHQHALWQTMSAVAGAVSHAEATWLKHAGLQGPAPRSVAGLLAMLKDRTGLRWQARSFVGGWQKLAPQDQAQLSAMAARGARLGSGACLGQKSWNQALGVALQVQVPDLPSYESLLPGGRLHGLVQTIASRHPQNHTRFILHPGLPPGCTVLAGLGGACSPRLGQTSWLGGVAHQAAPGMHLDKPGPDTASPPLFS